MANHRTISVSNFKIMLNVLNTDRSGHNLRVQSSEDNLKHIILGCKCENSLGQTCCSRVSNRGGGVGTGEILLEVATSFYVIAIHSLSLGQTMIFGQEKCNQHACQGLSAQSIDPSAPASVKNWVLLLERRTPTKFPDLELYATGLGSTPRAASTSASSASCSCRKSEHPRPSGLGDVPESQPTQLYQ